MVTARSPFGRVDSFVVNRPITAVARSSGLSPAVAWPGSCRHGSGIPGAYHTYVATYHPNVSMYGNSMEMSLQPLIKGGGTRYVGTIPKDGPYVLVTDAVSQGPHRTKVTPYHPRFGYKTIVRAIEGWATGVSVGCPDLTQ